MPAAEYSMRQHHRKRGTNGYSFNQVKCIIRDYKEQADASYRIVRALQEGMSPEEYYKRTKHLF